jgi:hypothetical protein
LQGALTHSKIRFILEKIGGPPLPQLFLAVKQALLIEISEAHSFNSGTFRGIQGHAGSTLELKGIQGNTR